VVGLVLTRPGCGLARLFIGCRLRRDAELAQPERHLVRRERAGRLGPIGLTGLLAVDPAADDFGVPDVAVDRRRTAALGRAVQPMVAAHHDQLAWAVIGLDQLFDQLVGVARIGRKVYAQPAMLDEPRHTARRLARVEYDGRARKFVRLE